MGKYKIEFRRSIRKDIASIPPADLRRIMERIGKLANEPRPPESKKLAGYDSYRIRQGNYRIIYNIEDAILIIFVVKIGHRRDIYRDI